jgi:hypothetical protein
MLTIRRSVISASMFEFLDSLYCLFMGWLAGSKRSFFPSCMVMRYDFMRDVLV